MKARRVLSMAPHKVQAAKLEECGDGSDLTLNAAGSKPAGVSARRRYGATRSF
jgi:hypothetical protein